MMMSSAPEGLGGAVAAAKGETAASPTPSGGAKPGAPTMKKTMVGVAAVGNQTNQTGPAKPAPPTAPAKPAMKQTMVGVSPFAETDGPAAKPTPAAGKPTPKKTMVGVAAMGLDAAPAPQPSEPARQPLESGPAPRGQSPNLKRTMVGVSPFGEADPAPAPAAAKPAAAKKVPKKTMMGVAAMGVGAAPSPEPPKADAAKPNLKQTMVGVSPFGSDGSATPSPAEPKKAVPKKTMVGVAAIGLGSDAPQSAKPAEDEAAAGMKATMIGTSPFGEPDEPAKPNLKQTVVGVAAVGASDAEAAAPAENPALKGTMVGMMPVGAEQTGGVDATVAMPQIDPASMEPAKATPDWAKPAAGGGRAHSTEAVQRVIGTTRNPGLSILWMMLVIPGIIQFFRMLGELNRFRAKDDISPWPFFVPILSLIKAIEIPGKLKESKEMAGIANATAPNVLLFLIVPGPLFAAALNEIWQSARNNAPSA